MKFTNADLIEFRAFSLTKFNELPSRCRLTGSTADLHPDEVRWLAIMDGALTFFNKRGMLKDEYAEPIELVKPQTESIFKDD